MKIKVFFEDGCGMESIRALGVLMSLEGMHSSIKTVPENLEDDCDGEIAQNGLLLVLENPIDKEAIEKASGTYGRFDEAVRTIDPRHE